MLSTNHRKRTPVEQDNNEAMSKKANIMPSPKHLSQIIHLQYLWRKKFQNICTKRLVSRFFKQGMTIANVQSISFEQLVLLLREKPVIAAARACLQRIHLLTTNRHGSPSSALAPENVNVRVFLAGYMIAFRPTHVFESMGTLEKALYDSAVPLLKQFEQICAVFQSGAGSFDQVPVKLTSDFPTRIFEFLKRFKAWKVPDEAKLTARIKHALIALYQAEEHLPPDEPEDSKLKIEFRTQIDRLRTKLQQIAGRDELAAFDELRKTGHHVGGSYPGGGGPPGGAAYAALPGRMTNEQLAHELLLDPTFQLDESGGCSVENPVFHRIRESFHTAFWDSLVDDLTLAHPCYVRVLRVLCEIRDGISDLAGSRMGGPLDEAMDMDFIKQQADAGLYGPESCRQLMVSILSVIQRVQMPKRDEETKTKWQVVADAMDTEPGPRTFCKALEFLLDRVNAMRIDAANARLRLIAPVIKDHGVDYERGKFQDKVNDGTYTLERTTAWIASTVGAEVTSNKAVELSALREGSAAAFVHVHSAAMLALVTSPIDVKPDLCPETLLFDVHRLAQLQQDFRAQNQAAALLTTAIHWSNKADHKAIMALDEVTLDALEPIVKKSEGAMTALRKCMEPNDPVHMLFGLRLRAVWAKLMRDGKITTECAFLRCIKPLFPKIDKAANRLLMLANLNRTVHLPTYNKLIREQAVALISA